jgi:hypothetical protein
MAEEPKMNMSVRTLVGMILLERSRIGEKTGFLAMKKMSGPDSTKGPDGEIIYRGVVKPIGIRWL